MNKPTAEQDESPSLSQQQYIEAIAALMKTRGQARASELAAQLGVSMPSVSQAIDRLVALGLDPAQSEGPGGGRTTGRSGGGVAPVHGRRDCPS